MYEIVQVGLGILQFMMMLIVTVGIWRISQALNNIQIMQYVLLSEEKRGEYEDFESSSATS